MSKLGKTILSSLEQMEADIEGAKLLGMVRQRKPMTHNILPEGFKYITETPEERVVLPIMTVNISGRAVRLEISPAAEPEVWWANIFCQVDKPAINFKMTRREALPWFSRGFMAAGLDDFLLGDMAFLPDAPKLAEKGNVGILVEHH